MGARTRSSAKSEAKRRLRLANSAQKAGARKLQATFEMRDGDHEWIGSVNELTVRTLAQAQEWVERQCPAKESGTIEVDAVTLAEVGRFADAEGVPCDSRLLGTYYPSSNEWEWHERA